MKVRTDFVTNSSSSSFILSFSDEDSIRKTLEEQFPKDVESYYLYQLLHEIGDIKRLSKKDLKELTRSEVLYGMKWDIASKMYNRYDPYSEMDTPEVEKKAEEEFDILWNGLLQKIGDDKVVVEVEHGDGGEGEDGVLEHRILPELDCTVIRFSHH